MKPTSAVWSDMPGPKNPWWGDKEGGIQKIRGVTTYTVSPFRQRAASHMFSGYLFNGYRRLSKQFIFWSIPVAVGYSTYAWAKKTDAWMSSKEGHLALAEHHE
ncbi:uncharacterized protein STEHIDRAFT_130709 [Stereum hirsutum FP-91666 SS1]|uniref:uncharacterized protein n=1 Tax=Stereum hirsutum (strain FP-91666) TaxID=721885 RepID=UPI000440DA5F|nr:uncharacterized protein STEHIDRAFT_130709 [Stereum hirsutum FP-91666 SS1]EIM87271.1 hypothetical protein STEHIDRAFT_130709 [Stereum hirsutum FP-91666 SS1]